MSDKKQNNDNILSPFVDALFETGNLLWKLISNNPNKVNWREEFLALKIKNNEDQTPKYLNCYEDDYRMEYLFALPVGLTVEDVEKSISRVATVFSKEVEYVSVERYLNKVKIIIDKGIFENELFKFDSLEFKPSKDKLLIPVGYYLKEGKRTLLYLDLSSSTQCHVLIGGSSGYGKSNVIKFMLSTITKFYKPSEIQFMLSDLKGTELPLFENVEHCLDYTDSPQETVSMVERVIDEMNRRYELFTKNKCKDIIAYRNKGFKLPYLVLLIDEFADLTLLAESGDIDATVISNLARLLQKGRSAGIICMFSLQTAKATLIPTEIRNNIPITIGLGCRDGNQSKSITGDSTDLAKLRNRPPGLSMIFGLPRFDNNNLVKTFYMPQDDDELEEILSPYFHSEIKELEPQSSVSILPNNNHITESSIVNKISGFNSLNKEELFMGYKEKRRPVAKKRQSHKSKKVKLDKFDKLGS